MSSVSSMVLKISLVRRDLQFFIYRENEDKEVFIKDIERKLKIFKICDQ